MEALEEPVHLDFAPENVVDSEVVISFKEAQAQGRGSIP